MLLCLLKSIANIVLGWGNDIPRVCSNKSALFWSSTEEFSHYFLNAAGNPHCGFFPKQTSAQDKALSEHGNGRKRHTSSICLGAGSVLLWLWLWEENLRGEGKWSYMETCSLGMLILLIPVLGYPLKMCLREGVVSCFFACRLLNSQIEEVKVNLRSSQGTVLPTSTDDNTACEVSVCKLWGFWPQWIPRDTWLPGKWSALPLLLE